MSATLNKVSFLSLSLVLAAGCAAETENPFTFNNVDLGQATDSSVMNDGSSSDLGVVDAGRDLGVMDAGRDLGVVDAGSDMAVVADAGRDAAVDAGSVDAGRTDAGTVDAGTVDAGTVDAGTVDAGGGTARMGMTFGSVVPEGAPTGTVLTSCHAGPAATHPGPSCNPYTGDTPCDEAHPILCAHVDASVDPAASGTWVSCGWMDGELASSSPHAGLELTSLEAANAICAAEFGAGFVMAEFHLGGGWCMAGNDLGVNPSDRSWTYISDQHANCWDP